MDKRVSQVTGETIGFAKVLEGKRKGTIIAVNDSMVKECSPSVGYLKNGECVEWLEGDEAPSQAEQDRLQLELQQIELDQKEKRNDYASW